MERVRFKRFTLLIDGIHKSINKIKVDVAPSFGVKGVHVLWIYELLMNPEGLTAAELAARSMVNRSLVSREIEELKNADYIITPDDGGSRYKQRYILTDKGKIIAGKICDEVISVQSAVNGGINDSDLEIFYTTLEKLNSNFEKLIKRNKLTEKNYEKQV